MRQYFRKFILIYQFSIIMESFENSYAFYKLDGGVLYIRYHIGIIITLNAAIKIVADRIRLQDGVSFPALCDMRGVREVNKPARDYLALEGSILLKAVAFLVEHPMSEVLSRFYLRTTKPPIPTQSFLDQKEAEKFLAAYI